MGNWLASWGGINTENNQMRNPERFDVAPDGTIYIADTANARVQRFRADGTWLMIVGRRANMLGQLEHPRDVTVDHNNNIYVVDSSNHQVHKFSAEGTWIASWGSKGSGAGQFRAPSGIASDGNSIIYVADTGNNRVQAFRLNGSWLASWGSKGSGTGQFNQPNGIAVDSTGLVYVADTGNHRVQKFHANGTSLKSWGNPGKGPGQFNEPKGIAVDDTGGVYVTDTGNHRVQKWSSDGQLLATWGSKGHNNGTFNYPIGIAVDESYIYVADSTNHRVQKLTKQGAWILSWGALDAEMGYFHKPMGLVVDSIGRVYVADSNNKRIQRFRPMSYTRPIATIVAASSRNVAQGQAVTLVGMGSDSDETSTIAGYGWFLDDEPTPIATTPRATLPTAHLAPGYHTLSFRVRDTEGEEASQTISLEIGHGTPSAETIWTFLLYLDGDNDTAPFLNQNSELGALYRLAHSAPNPSVRVVALYDGPQVGGGDSIRFVIEPDGRLRQEWLGEVDMGDPQTLINFVAWGKQYAPGDAYYLAIADHANALDGIAWDKTTGQNERLTNADIRHALSVITANGADPLDVLHFDGCLMGLMESAYQVRGLTRYLVASENLAWSVFAYEAYRKAIRPTTSAADLAIGIVDQYAERVGSANIPFTIAAIDMNLVDQAVRKIDVLAKGLIRYSLASTANSAVLEDLRQATQTLDSNGDLMLTHDDEYIDLDDWAERIQYNISDSTVQQAAKELRSVLAQLILHERHQSQSYRGAWVDLKNARGIGIYYPVQFSARTYQIYIQGELTFVVDTVWDEFLAAGLAALPFDPSEPQPIPVAPLPFETTTPKYHVHLPVLQR
jgi:sugar lactone lactonase YvrE